MRIGKTASWLLLASGLAGLGYAGLTGDLQVHLVVVIPVVSGTGPAAALGGLATIVGLAGLFWTSLPAGEARPRQPPGGHAGTRQPQQEPDQGPQEDREEGSRGKTRGGGVILLGPIPIAWGSDRSTLGWLVAGGIVLTLAAIALTLLLRG